MGLNPGGGAISDNRDVALNNPITGNVLTYDGLAAKWLNVPSMPLTATEHYVQPSGDTSGATDLANINSALSTGTPVIVILRGHYYINARIRMYSNTGLWANGSINNTIELVGGSNTNIVENADQRAIDAGGVGNANIFIQGLSFVGNPTLQTAGSGQGFLFQNVDGLTVNEVAIGPCRRMAAMHYGVRNARYTNIRLNQDRTTGNQDGLDWGPGCTAIEIDGVTGTTGDDCFSIFAKNTGGNTTAYTNSLTPTQRNVADITIRNVTVNVGINPLRLQAGDGSTLNRLKFYNITNTRPTTAPFVGSKVGVIGFGNTSYVTTLPASTDMRDIILDGYVGPGTWIIDAQSNFSRVRIRNVTFVTSGDTGSQSWESLIGCGAVVPGFTPTFHDISLTNVDSPKTTNAGAIIDLPAGTSASNVSISNIHVMALSAILAGDGGVSNCAINTIHIATATDILFQSSGAYSGTIDNVTVDAYKSGVTRTYGTALGLRLGFSMPVFVSADITPTPILGSIMVSDGTKNPTTDGLLTAGAFMATGAAWKRLV